MATGTMRLTLLSPERKLLEDEVVQELSLNTAQGEVEIFATHADYATQINTGRFFYVQKDGKKVAGVISHGYLRVNGDRVVVLAETLELENEIDKSRAKRAQEKAEEMLKDASLAPDHFRKYQNKLQRALIRQSF